MSGIGFGRTAGPGSFRSLDGLDLSALHIHSILDETDIIGVTDPAWTTGAPTYNLLGFTFPGPQTGTVLFHAGGQIDPGVDVGVQLFRIEEDLTETPLVIGTTTFSNGLGNADKICGSLATPVDGLVYKQLYRVQLVYRSINSAGADILSRRLIVQPTL